MILQSRTSSPPVVNPLEKAPGFHSVYDPLRNQGAKIWWYDSNNSQQPDPAGHYGNWPDEFIDHPGVNQLVHGPLTWVYGLDGYLYYEVPANYSAAKIWQENFSAAFSTNGDGTLFYPGRVSDIGGSSEAPVPSIRLQLLRTSWTIYDELAMLRDRGRGADANLVAAGLVTNTSTWSHDAQMYEQARECLASLLATTYSGG
jgi:hypothetical protein